MGVEKQGSRSGGAHVGGFLQLFDWSGKSQKKLPISAKLDENEGSRQGNISETSLQRTLIHLIDEDECAKSSMKGNSDYSCSSSVTDDGRNGSKSPGVVARLMGLDSCRLLVIPTPILLLFLTLNLLVMYIAIEELVASTMKLKLLITVTGQLK
ncbi:hypothetical protein GIB67_021869 [Kingdonia uniflora]|uniref:DUF3741 domain-containing protein n=1 Tax=Kingdonia uniflora TaxID=39325 RepID=A0A7J7NED1_9MAGN|nr:hypothetical protein GIB67_021869 [Kingdonia uniflora]